LKLLAASGRRAGETGDRGDRHFTGDSGGTVLLLKIACAVVGDSGVAPPPGPLGPLMGLPPCASSIRLVTSCCESGRESHCRKSWSSFSLAQGYIGWLSSVRPLDDARPGCVREGGAVMICEVGEAAGGEGR
jgi:hypothetical protein